MADIPRRTCTIFLQGAQHAIRSARGLEPYEDVRSRNRDEKRLNSLLKGRARSRKSPSPTSHPPFLVALLTKHTVSVIQTMQEKQKGERSPASPPPPSPLPCACTRKDLTYVRPTLKDLRVFNILISMRFSLPADISRLLHSF